MGEREGDPVHPGLLVTRFVRWAERPDLDSVTWTFRVRVQRRGKWKEEDLKRKNLDLAAKATHGVQGHRLHELAAAWRRRRATWLAPLQEQGLASSFCATTEWRLAIGLAGASPLETSIRLHHVFGVPVLSGSGLKGLARAAARTEPDVPEEAPAQVFGTQSAAGLVDVLDAIPVAPAGKPFLEVDVMNPHYPLWYRKATGAGGNRVPPSDDHSPNPIFFLTVPAGVEFEFAVVCRRRNDGARAALLRAVEWLHAGLRDLGAGAKTAAGYGYFTE